MSGILNLPFKLNFLPMASKLLLSQADIEVRLLLVRLYEATNVDVNRSRNVVRHGQEILSSVQGLWPA